MSALCQKRTLLTSVCIGLRGAGQTADDVLGQVVSIECDGNGNIFLVNGEVQSRTRYGHLKIERCRKQALLSSSAGGLDNEKMPSK